MDLNTTWFMLLAILLGGYAVLDGFDLGIGTLSLFARSDEERRIHMNAIGPVWDGNEVWLLTGGGAMFAAFPVVYATVFSGFYIALFLVLAALIFRAVSFEFRGKVDSPGWRRLWDLGFGLGSLLPAVLFGVAVGNILRGVPVQEDGSYTGTFFTLLNPFSLLVGVLSLVTFLMHGAIYLANKSEGELQKRVEGWITGTWIAFVALYVLASLVAWLESPFLFTHVLGNPLTYIFLILMLGGIITIPMTARGKEHSLAFLASSVVILSMVALTAIGLFPRLVPSSVDLAFSLTIYNACSSPRTLLTMLIIALIGMPIVIVYTVLIHRVFRGKVRLTPESY